MSTPQQERDLIRDRAAELMKTASPAVKAEAARMKERLDRETERVEALRRPSLVDWMIA